MLGALGSVLAVLVFLYWLGSQEPPPVDAGQVGAVQKGTATPSASQTPGQTNPPVVVTTPAVSPSRATVQPRTPATVQATFSAAGQVIDGQVDDWRGFRSYRATNQIFPSPGAATDLSAQWWLAWNRDALFVYTVVTDPKVTPVTGNASQAWKGDSASFEFGPDPVGLRPTSSLRSKDLHLILGVEDTTGKVVAGLNPASGKVIGTGGPATGVQATSWTVDGGYAIEAAIPWSTLKLNGAPDPGERFAMNLDASDAVTSGSRVGELGTMVSSNAARSVAQNRPGLWDVLVLDPAGAAG